MDDGMSVSMRRMLSDAEVNVNGPSYADMRVDRETRRQISSHLDKEIASTQRKRAIVRKKTRELDKKIYAKRFKKLRQSLNKSLTSRLSNRSLTKRTKQFTLDLRRGVR